MPVADMLAHSPPLPLAINFFDGDRDITSDDEEAIILALKQHDRIRRVCIQVPDLQEFAMSMEEEEEYLILEFLIMGPLTDDSIDNPHNLSGPKSASPRVDQLCPSSRISTTRDRYGPRHMRPLYNPTTHTLPAKCLSPMAFIHDSTGEAHNLVSPPPVPSRDIGQQVVHTPITTSVTHPELRILMFQGDGAYLEEFVCRVTTPRLEQLKIKLINELTFPVPCLLHFIDTTKNLRFDSSEITFSDDLVSVGMFLHDSEAYATHRCYLPSP